MPPAPCRPEDPLVHSQTRSQYAVQAGLLCVNRIENGKPCCTVFGPRLQSRERPGGSPSFLCSVGSRRAMCHTRLRCICMRALPLSFTKRVVFPITFTLSLFLGTAFLSESVVAQEQAQVVLPTPRPLI